MSELLLEGEVKCAEISSLDPSLYFDASVLFEDEVEEDDYEDDYEDEDEAAEEDEY